MRYPLIVISIVFYYICTEVMLKNQYLMFYNYFGKLRESPIVGILGNNESDGANGSLPFFVWNNRITRKS